MFALYILTALKILIMVYVQHPSFCLSLLGTIYKKVVRKAMANAVAPSKKEYMEPLCCPLPFLQIGLMAGYLNRHSTSSWRTEILSASQSLLIPQSCTTEQLLNRSIYSTVLYFGETFILFFADDITLLNTVLSSTTVCSEPHWFSLWVL